MCSFCNFRFWCDILLCVGAERKETIIIITFFLNVLHVVQIEYKSMNESGTLGDSPLLLDSKTDRELTMLKFAIAGVSKAWICMYGH